jgi:hypothetical protein
MIVVKMERGGGEVVEWSSDFSMLLHLLNTHPPGLRSAFEIFPFEFTGILGLELVIQRLGVMVVDQLKTLPGLEFFKGSKDQRVALGGRGLADINT